MTTAAPPFYHLNKPIGVFDTPLAVAGIACTSAVFVSTLQWPFQLLAQRALEVSTFEGLAPGIDLTTLLAAHLLKTWNFPPVAAMLAASLSALPFLIAIVLRTTPARNAPHTHALWITANPLTWTVLLSGFGWSAVGLFALWRIFADLPQRPPHQGMPLAGVGIGAAFICVPNFQAYLIPLAATLWLVAPQHMLSRHMRIFYVLSFTPAAMIWGAYAYTDWLFIGGLDAGEGRSLPLNGAILISGVLVAAPGLLFGMTHTHKLARIAAVLCLAMTALYAPQISVVYTAAMMAQAALAARWQEPHSWRMAWLAGGAATILGLEVIASSG